MQHDPLHEATYRGLVRLHVLNGNQGGALRAYHVCAETLGREPRVEPSAATQEAYERLVRQEGVATPAQRSIGHYVPWRSALTNIRKREVRDA